MIVTGYVILFDVEYPWEVLPVLEDDEGRMISQHLTILRYLGIKYGLAGENEYEMAKCDEYVEVAGDLRKSNLHIVL
jgi:glutathione S-transferase